MEADEAEEQDPRTDCRKDRGERRTGEMDPGRRSRGDSSHAASLRADRREPVPGPQEPEDDDDKEHDREEPDQANQDEPVILPA